MRPDIAPADIATRRRTSPWAALFGLVDPERLRTLLPLLLVALSSGRIVVALVAVVAVGSVVGVLSWWRRTWCLRDGVLELDEGILVRNERRIPVERIQHVEIERRLRHQALGLAALRVETAGGAGAELRLDAIPLAEAETARTLVLARHAAQTPDAPQPPTDVLVRLPWSRLLLAGITGPEVAAIAAALAFAFDSAVDLGVDPSGVDAAELSTFAVAVLAVLAVPTWLLTAGLVGVVRRWDLTAVVEGDELRVSYGLLRRHELVLRTERVQDVRISHRFLLRPFRRADLRVRTAASGRGDQSRVDIPLLAADEIERVLARVLPAALPLPTLVPAPRSARRRALVRGATIGAAVGAVPTIALTAGVGTTGLVLLAGTVAAGSGLGECWYRGLGLHLPGGHGDAVHSRTGTLTRNRAIVPVERVQSAATVATWFQRRRALATTRLDLAGAAIGVPDRAGDEARALTRASLGATTAPP